MQHPRVVGGETVIQALGSQREKGDVRQGYSDEFSLDHCPQNRGVQKRTQFPSQSLP